jgi:integrase
MAKHTKFQPKFSEALQAWVLNIPPGYSSKTQKRSRLFFKDRKEALEAALHYKEMQSEQGESGASFGPVEKGQAVDALYLLEQYNQEFPGANLRLVPVVREMLSQYRQRNQSVGFLELFNRYIEAEEHQGFSHDHKKRYEYLANQIRTKFPKVGEKMVSDIQREDLEMVLQGYASGSKNKFIKYLRAMWQFAIDKGWAKEHVAAKVPLIPHKKETTEIYSNDTIKKRLDYTLEYEPKYLPLVAICTFCGLRSASPEMQKLEWRDIDFEGNQIVIRAENTKTNERRIVPMSDNLGAWLKVYLEQQHLNPKPSDHVVQLPEDTQRHVRDRIKAALHQTWIPAGFRHTCASALVNSKKYTIDETCQILGHWGDREMFRKHYFLLSSEKQALAYWEIMPPNGTS